MTNLEQVREFVRLVADREGVRIYLKIPDQVGILGDASEEVRKIVRENPEPIRYFLRHEKLMALWKRLAGIQVPGTRPRSGPWLAFFKAERSAELTLKANGPYFDNAITRMHDAVESVLADARRPKPVPTVYS